MAALTGSEIKDIYKTIKKQIECPICLENIEIDDMKFSSCGHKYCETCLNKLKSEDPAKCAICRRKIY